MINIKTKKLDFFLRQMSVLSIIIRTNLKILHSVCIYASMPAIAWDVMWSKGLSCPVVCDIPP